MRVLVVNVGSTSFKYKFLEMPEELVLASGKIERIGAGCSPLHHQVVGKDTLLEDISAHDHADAIQQVLALLLDSRWGCICSLNEIDAVGFKAVHGGPISAPTLVTEELIATMNQYADAAPSHNPVYIQAMRITRETLPDVPLVAVFETSFHATIPDYAYTYSVPYEWYEKYGVRRYGFHGASFQYLTEQVSLLLARTSQNLKMVACHLGGSSSVCAISGGRSIDTSMGFTPQSGVPMGARCGDIDPFILPFIQDREGLSTAELREALTTRGGLLGISGISADVRDLEVAATNGNQRAQLALNTYTYQVKKYIGAYAAALGGLDALVFSGGIGENSATLRARICDGLEFLGIQISPERNIACKVAEALISTEKSQVPVLVVTTNEELIVARATARVVAGKGEG